MRDEQIAPVPRQYAVTCGVSKSACLDTASAGRDGANASPNRAGIPPSVWTIRPADGIRAARPLEPAESS
jgi:hypothetical protein